MLFFLLGFLFYLKSKIVLKRLVMVVDYGGSYRWFYLKCIKFLIIYCLYFWGFYFTQNWRWFWKSWWWLLIMGVFWDDGVFYFYLTEIITRHVKNDGLEDIYTLCIFRFFDSSWTVKNIWHAFIQSREKQNLLIFFLVGLFIHYPVQFLLFCVVYLYCYWELC